MRWDNRPTPEPLPLRLTRAGRRLSSFNRVTIQTGLEPSASSQFSAKLSRGSQLGLFGSAAVSSSLWTSRDGTSSYLVMKPINGFHRPTLPLVYTASSHPRAGVSAGSYPQPLGLDGSDLANDSLQDGCGDIEATRSDRFDGERQEPGFDAEIEFGTQDWGTHQLRPKFLWNHCRIQTHEVLDIHIGSRHYSVARQTIH